jgi:hypothetical protein
MIRPVASAVALLLILGWSPASASAQATPDFSGTWSHIPDRFVVVRNVPRDGRGGWSGHLRLGEQPDYVVTIAQTRDSIALTFPSGGGNFLTRPPFALDGREQTVIVDRGDFWTKHVQKSDREGDRLRLKAVAFAGWWRESDPETVTSQPTELGSVFVLSMSDDGLLTIDTTVSDEKGEAEYRQVFARR